ncbi:helix-turn-helix transcriptional regulator, partial [Streptomyces sp. SID9913]|nr:helix-turn-helix transcriptional regulator [Streptomyces sp. SID9913]
MLYPGFMSTARPPVPAPQEPIEPQELLRLGLGAEETCLRADAARNRARLLEAAARLVAERGADGLTMEAVAVAANVGKGTVFRRFGDRTGLLSALLDHSERKLQTAFLTGPPPLGPGAPPAERLRAFGAAV